ncbi:MAG: hypothetical protein OEY05_17320, partial [Paracoccaceae bacterium]|nr:hypothetical protein [Paracoccaceae bacterium]
MNTHTHMVSLTLDNGVAIVAQARHEMGATLGEMMAEDNAGQASGKTGFYWIGGILLGLLIGGISLFAILGPVEQEPGAEPAPVATTSLESAIPEVGDAPAIAPAPDALPSPQVVPAPAAEVASTASPSLEPAEADASSDAGVVTKPAGNDVAADGASEQETAAENPSAQPVPPPSFDTVRAEADGSVLVAGRSMPQAGVSILSDGVEIATATADGRGNFVALFTLPPSDAPRVLTLAMTTADGALVMAEESVIISPIAAPVAVAEVPTQEPEAPEEIATEDSGTAPTTQTADASETAAAEPVAVASAPEATEEAVPVAPKAPEVLVLDSSGVRKQTEPGSVRQVVIDIIGYDQSERVTISGRGTADSDVRLYLNNRNVAIVPVDSSGRWRVPLSDIDAGIYTLRVDQVDAAGKVTSRFETPFLRENPETVAAAIAPAPEAPATTSSQTQTDTDAVSDASEAASA